MVNKLFKARQLISVIFLLASFVCTASFAESIISTSAPTSVPVTVPASWQLNLQKFLSTWRVNNHIPAAVVSIQTSDDKITTFLSGTTQMQGTTSVQKDNLFGVGSISKTFVAVVVLQLQQEGKLKITDTIGKYFPEYPRWKNITIKQLLNMTSGIPNHSETTEYKNLLEHQPQKRYPLKKFTDIAYKRSDYFSPGKSWHYSNTNYYLLAMLVEKVTQQPFATELQERILIPLKLKHTFYSDKSYPAVVQVQMVHGYQDRLDVTYDNPAYYGPAGSMMMNSLDLINWTNALFTPGEVLSQKSLTEMMTTVSTPLLLPKPQGSRYGLGIYSLTIPNLGVVWWYTGVIRGYSSIMMWIPSKRITITAQIDHLQNNNYGLLMPGREFMQQVLKIIDSKQTVAKPTINSQKVLAIPAQS